MLLKQSHARIDSELTIRRVEERRLWDDGIKVLHHILLKRIGMLRNRYYDRRRYGPPDPRRVVITSNIPLVVRRLSRPTSVHPMGHYRAMVMFSKA
jgi:hypothetical protein